MRSDTIYRGRAGNMRKHPIMQRRHYRFLAPVVADMGPETCRALMALKLSEAFAKDNPEFSKLDWFKACGYDGREIGITTLGR